jgi:hypothetical protein
VNNARCRIIVVSSLMVVGSLAHAGEGMWLPEQLDDVAHDLTTLGLRLDPALLGELAREPLSAIVSLGGCSASFVSPDGLVITNHHCVEGALALNSTGERNLVDQGFDAGGRDGEIYAGPGSRVYVTQALDDVTETVRAAIDAATDDRARYEALDRVRKELVAECEAPGSLRCSVASYFNGEEYRLIRQLEIEDVRLVWAPPAMIGFFGGDIDNWMWPRHTGDFAFLRAYVGPDGAPAPHAEENVPYRPPGWLRIATDGLDAGDFVMVAGYPGSTSRYRTGWEVTRAAEVRYPWQVATMRELLAILDARSAEDADAEVRLASSRFGIANYLKNNEGMLDGLVAGGAAERARERDAALAAADPAAAAAIAGIEALLAEAAATEERDFIAGWMRWSVDLVSAAGTAYKLAIEREETDDLAREAGYQERDWDRIRERFGRIERSYDAIADERLLAYWMRRASELPADARIDAIDALLARHARADDPAAAAAADVYARTALADEQARFALLDADRADLEASSDPIVALAVALEPLTEESRERDKRIGGALLPLRLEYMRAIRAAAGRAIYPDANSTLRVTFGLVRGYSPADGVYHTPFTTLAGIAAKHTGEEPFDAPDVLLEAIEEGAPSRFGDASLNAVPVDFLSDLDTTGGNSGSATLNARGELVGLLFDGNYEAMASDWVFDPVATRSIHVDIRYALWLLDRVYGARWLLDEMGISQ